jgi:DNA-directed RNA polymerase subunit RPC12/RpoP
MSLAHFIFEVLEFLPNIFLGPWSAVSCPRCGVEVQLLQRKAKLYRCPACEKLWVRINKKLQPFISSHLQ